MSEASPASNDRNADSESATFPLTEEHRMLLDIRDTLYEGSWEDFKCDLEARRQSLPHVFDTVPESPRMLKTIRNHLELIRAMWNWERTHKMVLSSTNTRSAGS